MPQIRGEKKARGNLERRRRRRVTFYVRGGQPLATTEVYAMDDLGVPRIERLAQADLVFP